MIIYRQLFYCIIHVDQKTQKVSKKSLYCSVVVKQSTSIESCISSESSSSSEYTSMGSIDETDSGYEGQSRVQCDAGFSAQLDFINQGGSLIEFLDNGNLALAPPSKPSSSASPSGPSSSDPPPCK